MQRKTLVLVDGHALTFRAFFALERTRMAVRSTGEPTYAVQGFFQILLTLLQKYQPEYLAVTFDVGRTFRDDLYPEYKAGRSETPAEFHPQMDRIHQIIRAMNIPIFTADGFEADDVIGTLARQATDLGVDTLIVTGDSDVLQLVDDHVHVLLANPQKAADAVTRYDVAQVQERYKGLLPHQLTDLRGLKGDTSDNIPGVKGIGEAGAISLLNQFGSIEGIYQHLDEVPNRYRTKLEGQEQIAMFCKHLATIVCTVPLTLDLAATTISDYNRASVIEVFRELEMRKLIDKLPVVGNAVAVADVPLGAPNHPLQMDLFGTTPATTTLPLSRHGDYRTVDSSETLAALVAALEAAPMFAFDTETTGLHPYGPHPVDLVGISIAAEPGVAWYIPLGHRDGQQLALDDVREALQPAFRDPQKGRIGHNAKFDVQILTLAGFEVGSVSADVMIIAALLGEKQALKELAFNKLGIEMTEIEALIGRGKTQITMADVPIAAAADYAAADADMTLRLLHELLPQLQQHDHVYQVYTGIEMPLVPVLAALEAAGIAVDSVQLADLGRDLGHKLAEIESDIAQFTNAPINIQSRYELNDLLFQTLGLPTGNLKKLSGTTKTGGAVYSITADVLEGLAHHDSSGIVRKILQHRRLAKLKSTYVDILQTLVNPRTNRVHGQFRQMGAETGRLASENPNLQNIPVRTEEGREIRRAFVATPGHVLLAADYSQIELRILAHITEDPSLLEVFRTGQDIHAATASQLFNLAPSEVTKNHRRIAKTVVFGVIYGISSFGLSARTELSRDEAKQLIDALFARYPGIERYIQTTIANVQRDGYISTLFGRRRYFRELLEGGMAGARKNAAEREAINAGIQGTAADLIKMAMVRLDAELKASNLDATMVLQVHDELVLEVAEADVPAAAALVRQVMEGIYPALLVPLEVNVEAGANWDALTPVH